jgi:hypothetical protein
METSGNPEITVKRQADLLRFARTGKSLTVRAHFGSA